VGERDILAVLRETRAAMVADLMKRLQNGKINRRSIDTQRRSKFRGFKKAHADLERVLSEVGEAGMSHVEDELERQEGAL